MTYGSMEMTKTVTILSFGSPCVALGALWRCGAEADAGRRSEREREREREREWSKAGYTGKTEGVNQE